MDGVVIDLLNAKWSTFVKNKFYRQFYTFALYFIISVICFTLRPGPPVKQQTLLSGKTNNSTNKTLIHNINATDILNLSLIINETLKLENFTSLLHFFPGNATN